MSRHLLMVTASLTLAACVYQPYGYYRPYSSAYYPQPLPGAYQQPAAYPQPSFPLASNPPYPSPGGSWPQSASRAPSASPAASDPGQEFDPPPVASRPEPRMPPSDPDVAEAGGDGPHEPINLHATFADETVDYGVQPTNTLHLANFDAPTPTHIERANTITTRQLQGLLNSPRPPVLVDVIGGQQNVSLPNAVWLRDAGVGRHMDDDVQAWLDLHLSQLTGHDKARPLVFFCASRMCWLAHNAVLRAIDLGYTNLYWYRGGRDSWQAAGLPMSPVPPSPVDN
jgi:PQQ-dependent catabolism-associated CXXCW motif protein